MADRNQLSLLALEAKARLAVEEDKVVADMGYAHGQELNICLEADLEPWVVLNQMFE